MMEKGSVCIKTRGRKAGMQLIVVGTDEKSGFVKVADGYGKVKRCNPRHLWPTGAKAEPKVAKEEAKPQKEEKAGKETKAKGKKK